MRISTALSYDRSMSYLQKTNTKLDTVSEQYNTGLKFKTAAQDPTGMGNKLRFDAEISTYTQYSVNAGLASDALGLEETALSIIYETLSSCVVSLQSAVNGTFDKYNLDAVATSLEESLALVFDLTNTKTAEGEYIFSGSQSMQPTMVKVADGSYQCQADAGFRQVKVSPSVKVTTSDSGLGIFQQSQICRTASSNDASISYSVSTQFDSFVNNIYVAGGNNDLTMNIDNATGTYQIMHGTDVLQKGSYKEGDTIGFEGLEITPNAGTISCTISLDEPKNDNMLNTLSQMITALRNEDLSKKELTTILQQGQVALNNSKENVNVALGHVGGRLNNIEKVINSNEALNVIKQEARANITEVDAYEATSELVKQQNALQVAQRTFSMVNGSTLFDYIN